MLIAEKPPSSDSTRAIAVAQTLASFPSGQPSAWRFAHALVAPMTEAVPVVGGSGVGVEDGAGGSGAPEGVQEDRKTVSR